MNRPPSKVPGLPMPIEPPVDTWIEQSLFADLLAQCAFLINTEELPNTCKTAIGVIDRTLAVLDP
jgi:hypothetical protein